MNFSFTAEQEHFRKSVRSLCEEKLAPRAAEIDEKGEIPREVIEDFGAAGLFGVTVSKEFGGSGAGFVKAAIVAEEIARAEISMALAVCFVVEAGWGFILDRYGNARLKGEVLPDVVKGRSFLCIASTEASGGSDIASTSTTLMKKNGKLVVNGAKSYISGVKEAARYGGGYVTIVKTDPELAHKGLSLCYLPVKDQAGVTVTGQRQMGREGISNGFIKIDNAEIPEHYFIGEWNRGFYHAMEGFNCARTLVSAACIGAAGRVLEDGISYLRKRKVFKKPLAVFQGIQFQLAEDHVRLESARLLVYKAAWMLDSMYGEGTFSHKDINKAVAAAKIYAPTTAFDIIKDVMMWHGAYGYTKAAGLERGLRGVASYLMGAEGAQNIMKLIIARDILGKEFF
ncbi:MAG TPA: acyl-CoA dehydrogenase family protein [Geobacteraceae bacterium]|nr:acyl-CoA dehydrogenase family protein [Geobacteraceae bacterium]